MGELKELGALIPNHIVIEKALWVGNVKVEIEHFDDDLGKPLDYVSAFKKMIAKINPTDPE